MSEVQKFEATFLAQGVMGGKCVSSGTCVLAADHEAAISALQSRLDAAEQRAYSLSLQLEAWGASYTELEQQLAGRDAVLRECRNEFDTSEATGFEFDMRQRIDALLSSAEPVKCKKCGQPCTHDDDAYDECRFCNAEVPSSGENMTAKGGDGDGL